MPPDPSVSRSFFSRRTFLAGGGAVAALALYSGEVARHELDVVAQTVAVRNLPEAFEGYRIAQLSDIHLEEFTEPSFLRRVVARVNALAPDLVLLTGDYVSRGPFPDRLAVHAAGRCGEVLRGLACEQRLAVLGNHDVSVGGAMVISALTEGGITVLENRFVAVERGGARLWICGVKDPGASSPDLAAAVPERPDGPVLLMAHAPDYADTVVRHPRSRHIDLMIAGHSHGGQVRLPFLGPMILPPMGKKYVEGLFRLGEMQLYVNRGIGTVGMPFRLNCPPEITVFKLVRAEAARLSGRGRRAFSAWA